MKMAGTFPLSRFSAVFLAAMASALLTPAMAAEPAAPVAPADSVIARAGGVTLSAEDVRGLVAALAPAEREAVSRNPSLLSQVLRQQLAGRLVSAEARAKKFDAKPEVKAKLDAAREAALAELYLQSAAKAADGFPSEDEIKAAYEANKSAFVAPRQYRLAQIYIAAPQGDKAAEDKGKAKLAEVQRSLKAKDADFGRAAAQFSDAKTEAEKGGEIGWVAESQLVPDIRSLAAGLAKGGISEPVRLGDGFVILKLLDTKPAGTLPLAEVKEALAERLRQARTEQLRQAYLARLLAENPPSVNEMALSTIMQKDIKK